MEMQPLEQAQLKEVFAGDPAPACPLPHLLFRRDVSRTAVKVNLPSRLLEELERTGRIRPSSGRGHRSGLSEETTRALVYYLMMRAGSGDRPGLPALMVRYRDDQSRGDSASSRGN